LQIIDRFALQFALVTLVGFKHHPWTSPE
jgi:hypothetical protein